MEAWRANICGCFEHVPACLLSFFCWPLGTCCLHLSAASKAMNGCMAPYYMVCYCGIVGYALNRERIRLHYNIGGDCCSDCLIWYCCPCCAGVQEFREVILRGLDPKQAPVNTVIVYANQPGPGYPNPGQPNPGYPQPPNYALPPGQNPSYAPVYNPLPQTNRSN